ncbi:hypothetical protein T492DRAFT_1091291 [Pavlovales sp. CCMP2436]|nr:hypothetical protein T492DRAFT_1091291 [Pavlovales sp. CCMP2436]
MICCLWAGVAAGLQVPPPLTRAITLQARRPFRTVRTAPGVTVGLRVPLATRASTVRARGLFRTARAAPAMVLAEAIADPAAIADAARVAAEALLHTHTAAETFAPIAAAVVGAPLALFGSASFVRPRSLSDIYVRPGVGRFGVGLIAVRDIQRGTRICQCESAYAKAIPRIALATLRPGVRQTIHELFDGFDAKGNCLVPTDYEQALPLISFLNHVADGDGSGPTCTYDAATNTIVAGRRLRRGEECTVDYTKYQEKESLTHRQAASKFNFKYWL